MLKAEKTTKIIKGHVQEKSNVKSKGEQQKNDVRQQLGFIRLDL